MPARNRYDALITTHADGTADLTLYKAATTDAVLEARLLNEVRWQAPDGRRVFDHYAGALSYVLTNVPHDTIYEQEGSTRWTF